MAGKHIHVRAPDSSGTAFFNYKKSFSIVLMAVVDAEYKFTMIDVGQMGSVSDGGVWDHSDVGSGWNQDKVNTPPPQRLPGTDVLTPYFLVGDEDFPLNPNLMRPFPGVQTRQDFSKRRFNYRLSRARRVVENAFGILSSRWRCLFSPIDAPASKAKDIVKALCVLHNYLCSVRDGTHIPIGYADQVIREGNVVDGFWRAEPDAYQLQRLVDQPPRRPPPNATDVRNTLKDWVANDGARAWQDGQLMRT